MEKLVTEEDFPSWLTQCMTVLAEKDPQQASITSKYRPITCLSTIWKLLSGILADKTGVHMNLYMHKDLKGIGGENRGLKHQMLINQSVAKDAQSRLSNTVMVWINYKTDYGLMPNLRISIH